MFAYIGRQPIYNSDYVIDAYELLYRNNEKNSATVTDDDTMTRHVLSEAVGVFGFAQLTDGKPAYINFTRNLLMDDFAYLLDPKEVVIEIPGNIYLNDRLLAKLSELQSAGYTLSLNSYNEQNGIIRFNQMIGLFDIIRLDFSKHNPLQLRDMLRKLRHSRARLLAERIETEEDFDTALNLHFTLFQGYYFERPVCLSKQIALGTTAYGRLLNEFLIPGSEPNLDICARIIQSDAVLTHMFLSHMSMTNAPRDKYASLVNRGVTKIGTDGLRRWICVVMLKQNNITSSDELPRRAYLRGCFIERLMQSSSNRNVIPLQGFFLGILSLMDRVTGVSMEEITNDLYLFEALKDALTGRVENDYALFLQYAVIYEMANSRLTPPDIGIHLKENQLSTIYMDCTRITDSAFAEFAEAPSTAYNGTVLRSSLKKRDNKK